MVQCIDFVFPFDYQQELLFETMSNNLDRDNFIHRGSRHKILNLEKFYDEDMDLYFVRIECGPL